MGSRASVDQLLGKRRGQPGYSATGNNSDSVENSAQTHPSAKSRPMQDMTKKLIPAGGNISPVVVRTTNFTATRPTTSAPVNPAPATAISTSTAVADSKNDMVSHSAPSTGRIAQQEWVSMGNGRRLLVGEQERRNTTTSLIARVASGGAHRPQQPAPASLATAATAAQDDKAGKSAAAATEALVAAPPREPLPAVASRRRVTEKAASADSTPHAASLPSLHRLEGKKLPTVFNVVEAGAITEVAAATLPRATPQPPSPIQEGRVGAQHPPTLPNHRQFSRSFSTSPPPHPPAQMPRPSPPASAPTSLGVPFTFVAAAAAVPGKGKDRFNDSASTPVTSPGESRTDISAVPQQQTHRRSESDEYETDTPTTTPMTYDDLLHDEYFLDSWTTAPPRKGKRVGRGFNRKGPSPAYGTLSNPSSFKDHSHLMCTTSDLIGDTSLSTGLLLQPQSSGIERSRRSSISFSNMVSVADDSGAHDADLRHLCDTPHNQSVAQPPPLSLQEACFSSLSSTTIYKRNGVTSIF